MLPFALLGLSLGPGISLRDLAVLAVVGVLAWLAFQQFNKKGGNVLPSADGEPASEQSEFMKKAAKLLTFVDSLGLLALKPLLLDLSQGNFLAVPGHVLRLFDALDDKQSRATILDSLFYSPAGLDRQLEDPDRQKRLIGALQAKLGVAVVDPKSAAEPIKSVAEPKK